MSRSVEDVRQPLGIDAGSVCTAEGAHPEWASRLVGTGGGQAATECVVHNLLERLVEQLRSLLEGASEVIVQGERGAHTGIVMSAHHDVKMP